MAKIRQAEEKRERNALYALKYKKKDEDKKDKKGKKKHVSKYANWCRRKGHPPTCRVSECLGK